MNDDLGEAIKLFLGDRLSYKKNLCDALFKEIFDTIKGQQSSRFFGRANYHQTFYFFYDDPLHRKDALPDMVKWNDISKEFSDAFGELYIRILSQIENRHEQALTALMHEDREKRKIWIRITLGLVLHNDIFSDEIQHHFRKITHISIDGTSTNDEAYHPEVLDKECAEAFWDIDPAEQIIQSVDDMNLQKDAFFWVPGTPFQDKKLEGKKADRAVYIAFFYSWLRKCSHATSSEVGKETKVSASTVSRDWTPHDELKDPFSEDAASFYPVYFDDAARSSMGMYDRAIRCYSKKDYDDNGAYAPILQRKKILWDIYAFLGDAVKMDFLESAYDQPSENLFGNNACPFAFKLRSNDDIGIHPKKRYSLVCITSVEVR